MKKFNILFLTLFLLSAMPVIAEVVIIVHPSNNSDINKALIKRIYLGKTKKFTDGKQVVPVNQQQGSTIRTEFSNKLLGKSGSQLKAYWSKLIFTGKGTPPNEVISDAEVINLVSKNPNIIGYIQSNTDNSTVKVVGKF